LAREDRIYAAILVVLAVCYSAQVFTPLRLNNDAVILLSEADSAAHNGGFLFHGRSTLYPPGYPALLASLLRMGIAHAWVIVAINVACLFLGLFAVRYILSLTFFREQRFVLSICVVSLLSFLFIKFFTIPLTDVPFFCLAMCSLAAMERALRLRVGTHFWLWLSATGILVLGSIAVRSVGIALIPAFLWMVISHPKVKKYLKATAVRVAISTMGVLACGAVLARSSIVADLNLWFRNFELSMRSHTLTNLASTNLGFRLRELGEITANVPFIVVPEFARQVIPWAGAFLLTGLMSGLFLQRKTFGPTEVFVISYLAILIAWPYYDPRFWLPLIPLLISYCTLTMKRLAARHPYLPGTLLGAYLAFYSLIGMELLVSSTMITFSRSAFLTIYVPENQYGSAYCAVLGPCKDGFDPRAVDQNVAHLLRLYK
jgi:hypothetical protein